MMKIRDRIVHFEKLDLEMERSRKQLEEMKNLLFTDQLNIFFHTRRSRKAEDRAERRNPSSGSANPAPEVSLLPFSLFFTLFSVLLHNPGQYACVLWVGKSSSFCLRLTVVRSGVLGVVARFPATLVREMARGFGRHPQLLGSTSLDGGETSGGRFEGEWTERRNPSSGLANPAPEKILLKFLFETDGGKIRRAWSRGEISGDSGPGDGAWLRETPSAAWIYFLDGGKTSRGRFKGELRVTTFEVQEDEEFSIMHLFGGEAIGS
ncbi:hypothetical protein F2Q68_00027910 [Brassica cretica]|uniref:Uncharacterized protein n=1 Tax=Brassica cretica TaxID=69181 RepID=A0A8S9I8W3_BRACR|nr:hypothetical protein F2Q68_00027910 [Brassica cretica]